MADEQDISVQEPAATAEPAPKPDADEALGETGLKALQRERDARKALEKRLADLEPLAVKAKELEDASKSEIEKATERLTAAEKRAQEAEIRALRLEVAATKGLTPAQARRLVGSTQEELESDADDLLATFGAKDDDKSPTPRRPVEKLKPGAAPAGEPEETDPRKLALAMRERSPRYA